MPQFIPFFWVNQCIWTLATLAVIVYVISKYILPYMVEILVIRTFITKI